MFDIDIRLLSFRNPLWFSILHVRYGELFALQSDAGHEDVQNHSLTWSLSTQLSIGG